MPLGRCEEEQELDELRRRHAEHLRAELDSWSLWRHSAPDFYRYWRPEAPNLVAAVNWMDHSDPALTVDLLAPTVEVFVTGGKGPWCLDALETSLASSPLQGDRRLFGLTRLMLGSLLMLDRDRGAAARSQALAEPPSVTDAHAYFAASAAISAVTADPHRSGPAIASVESFRDTVSDPEAFESRCTALDVNRLALIGHHNRAIDVFLDGPSGLDIGLLWVSSAASSALVCAYIANSPHLERIAGMARSMNRCDPLYDGGADALLVVTGPGSVEERGEALTGMAHNGVYQAMASYEAIYLGCFARLAYERGDRDHAQQLLEATPMRSAAISTLMKATHIELRDLSPDIETSRDVYQDFFAHRRTPGWDQRTSAIRLLEEELRAWNPA